MLLPRARESDLRYSHASAWHTSCSKEPTLVRTRTTFRRVLKMNHGFHTCSSEIEIEVARDSSCDLVRACRISGGIVGNVLPATRFV